MGKIFKHVQRPAIGFLAGALAALLWVLPASGQPEETFDAFKERFETVAVSAGIDRSVYRAAMDPVTEDPTIAERITGQPAFATSIWDYVDARVSTRRVLEGRKALAAYQPLFDRVGQAYGIDPYLLAAIWGMETDYGSALYNSRHIGPLIPALANVVYQRRGRLAKDEAELIAALRLIQDRDIAPDDLVGEWAGGIGHTQVLPSLILIYGQDGDGDGVVDPHNSLADALETSAAFLRAADYVPGLDWGLEVTVPSGFDYGLADNRKFRPLQFFMDRGVMPVEGRAFPDPDTEVALYVPAGASGPKFLVTRNYNVLKEYNRSDAYALSVAHLTDRLKGMGPLIGSWPQDTAFPNREERFEIQEWLAQLGYYDGAIDGLIGPVSQDAYAKFQADRGMVADGFVTAQSHALLQEAVREADAVPDSTPPDAEE